MSEQIDINDYLLGDEADISVGDELRVRPWKAPAKTYNQGGPNTGPAINEFKLIWGQPVTIVESETDPAAQKLNVDMAKQMRDLLMTETNYQNYQSETA